jgi:hypothetical protein
MRDLGPVLDHEGSLGERRLTVAATNRRHSASNEFSYCIAKVQEQF